MQGEFGTMRKKEERLVITFHTTAEAMAAEKAFREGEIPGRLIPVPGQISAGCGLAWSGPLDWKTETKEFMDQRRLVWEERGIYLI